MFTAKFYKTQLILCFIRSRCAYTVGFMRSSCRYTVAEWDTMEDDDGSQSNAESEKPYCYHG